MDMVKEILQVMNTQNGAITIRHLAYRTGYAPSTIVGVMMGMINQGYVTRGTNGSPGTDGEERCSCACCTRKPDRESTTSLDIQTYRITAKGLNYLRSWAGK